MARDGLPRAAAAAALPERLGEPVDPEVVVLHRDDAAGREPPPGGGVPAAERGQLPGDRPGVEVVVLRQEAAAEGRGEVARRRHHPAVPLAVEAAASRREISSAGAHLRWNARGDAMAVPDPEETPEDESLPSFIVGGAGGQSSAARRRGF